MLSGAHGIGKSGAYSRDLQYGEVGARFIPEIHESETIKDSDFEGSKTVIALDEVTTSGPAHYADFIEYGVAHGKQFACITPGPSADTRKRMVDTNTAALAERGIEVNYLGDVSGVHISPERSAKLLTALGVSQDVIQRFEEIPALRSPRLFALLMDSFFYADDSLKMTAGNLKETLDQLIDGCGR